MTVSLGSGQGEACHWLQLASQQALMVSSLLPNSCLKCFWSVLKIRFWGVLPSLSPVHSLKAKQWSAYHLPCGRMSWGTQVCGRLMGFLGSLLWASEKRTFQSIQSVCTILLVTKALLHFPSALPSREV